MPYKTLDWQDSTEDAVYAVVARVGNRRRRFYFSKKKEAQEKYRELTRNGIDRVRVELLCGH
jgi:hypothetical protein